VAKTAAVEAIKNETGVESEAPEQTVTADVSPSGSTKQNTLTSTSTVLVGDKESVIERRMAQAELLFQQMIDVNQLGVDTTSLVAGSTDVVEQVPVRSVPYPSPPLHAQGPGGGGNTGTYSNQVLNAPGKVTNFIQQPQSSVETAMGSVTMELGHAQSTGILVTENASKGNHGEPQAKRPAAFVSSDLPVHMMIQLVDGPKPLSDEKMHWIVGDSHPVVGTHLGLIDASQPVLGIPSESFSFKPKLDANVTDINNEVIFNLSSGFVFSPAFPASAVDGFRDGPPVGSSGMESRMSVEDIRMLDVGLSSGPQSMETNAGTFISDHPHADDFIESASFISHHQGNSLHDGGTVLSPNQNENRGVFLGTVNGLRTQSVIGMDVSSSAVHPTPISVVDVASSQFSGSDSVAFGSGNHVYVSSDELQEFIDHRSEIRMEISTRQIAGMNLPEGLSSPLSIVTPPLPDASTLQQTLAELIDLQQQVAALGGTSGGTSSAPQSPPYRRLSVSRQDAPASVVKTPAEVGSTPWSVANSAAPWSSDAVFHDSLSPHSNQASSFQGCVSVQSLEGIEGQSITNSVSIVAKSFTDVYEADHLDNAGELIPMSSPVFAMSNGISHTNDMMKWSSAAPQALPGDHCLNVLDELFKNSNTAYGRDLNTPDVRDDLQSAPGGIFSVLVGSSQSHATVHHHARTHNAASDLPLTSPSLVNVPVSIVHLNQPFASLSDVSTSIPFMLVSSLQSADVSTRDHPVLDVNSAGVYYSISCLNCMLLSREL